MPPLRVIVSGVQWFCECLIPYFLVVGGICNLIDDAIDKNLETR